MKTLINGLIICSSIFLIGCTTIKNSTDDIWIIPHKPILKKVEITHISTNSIIKQDGYYISFSNARNLADNVDELKGYSRKMELLLEAITKQYNIKLREIKKTNE